MYVYMSPLHVHTRSLNVFLTASHDEAVMCPWRARSHDSCGIASRTRSCQSLVERSNLAARARRFSGQERGSDRSVVTRLLRLGTLQLWRRGNVSSVCTFWDTHIQSSCVHHAHFDTRYHNTLSDRSSLRPFYTFFTVRSVNGIGCLP